MSRNKKPTTNTFPWKEFFVFFGVVLAAYIGYLGIRYQIDIPIRTTQTAEARLTALANTSSIAPPLTPSPTLSSTDLELAARAIDTQRAQEAGATATHQYLVAVQTFQANATATSLYGQVAAEQTQNAEATVQAIISTQQTATAIAHGQKIGQILSFAEQVPNLPISFFDSFVNNNNGWSPKSNKEHSMSLKGDELKVNFSGDSETYFIWTCKKCISFSNFSYQVDIKTPKGTGVSGIVFGSPTRLDQQPLQEYYGLSISSSSDIVLERFSPSGRDIVKIWNHRRDLFTADGEFHTLQIIGFDKYAAVYIDGKSVGDIFSLDYSTEGYIGLFVQSKNIDVVHDNLKVVLLR